jgi:anti-sigma-K factor RskA
VDVKEYISSGAIEAYVLGLADEQEVVTLLQLKNQYPEVAAAITSFEDSLEKTSKDVVHPPANLKNSIITQISHEFKAETPVVAIRPQNNWRKYLSVAAIFLLISSSALNLFFYNELRSANFKYKELLAQNTSAIAANQIYQTRLFDMQESMQMMTDPVMKRVMMAGVKGHETAKASVYWDTQTKDVYVFASKLPRTPDNMQYQLWAIVDGKPVDAGMLESDCNGGLCKLKNIQKAQAFAITLEKKGGSPTPNLEQLHVIGNI